MWRVVLISLCLSACGPQSQVGVTLGVRLPAALARGEARRVRFEQRVRYLSVRLVTRGGVSKEFQMPLPSHGQPLFLPPIGFPQDRQDRLQVLVQVWDRAASGEARAYPALVGTGRIAATELAEQGLSTVWVPLSLRLPVSEYD
ncbi:hypothetical protein K2X33_01600 [bacterium]|nr:hypothetical protein [bacterium]